ncbi:MAG: hypothetical protein AB7I19_11155 [Planctomycetota bacterium]
MRANLLLPLGLLSLALAAWLVFVQTGARAAPSPAPPESSSSPAPPPDMAGLEPVRATSPTPDPDPALDGPTEATEERQAVVRGRGRLQLELQAPSAIVAEPFVLGLVPEEADNPAPERTLIRSPERVPELAPLDLPAGSYRVFVVSGPGDPRGCETSSAWTIDEFDDVVQVVANQTSKASIKITTAVEAAPRRGVARISGLAFIDGAPAVNCFVTTSPLTRSRIVRVNADGSFDLGEVEAGSLRVQLSEPTDGIKRDAFLARLAHLDVAPAPGEALGIRLEAYTGSIEVAALDSRGDSVGGTAEVLGVPSFALPSLGTEIRNVPWMSERLSVTQNTPMERIPAGRIGVVVRSHGYSSDPVWIDLMPGAHEVVRVPMRAVTEVRVQVDWDSFGAPERAGAAVIFRGPTNARVTVNRHWRGTAYLLPGDYAVEVQIRPLQVAAFAAQPLRVVAGEPQSFTARAAR